jgi:RNA polymerase sigma-70 factor, ECF subfamily
VYNLQPRSARDPRIHIWGFKMTKPSSQTHQVSQLLVAWSQGDKEALDKLMPLVYDELRRLARQHMRREHAGHMLQTTALVNEAYLRLVDQRSAQWQNRAQFFGVAAQLMRRILVDHARGRQRMKRAGDVQKVSLDEAAMVSQEAAADLLALHEGLEKLEAVNERMGRIIELRFFGGLSIEETAEVLKVSPGTVMKDWTFAKAFLHEAISNEA